MPRKKKKKVLILVVAYNAEGHIESVFERIPDSIWDSKEFATEVLIIDDSSSDKTAELSLEFKKKHRKANMRALRNPVNQGYGGNQKLGYYYAVQNGFDIVVLLHGDGQYAPELLPDMIAPILDGDTNIVLGSRMLNKWGALKGGMPLYKFLGNRILTIFQNVVLKSSLAEFHTGYRAYDVRTLKSVPFEHNSNDFDFDTDVLIQAMDVGSSIKEIPVPTFYGDEICHVNGIKYAFKIIRSSFLSRLQKYGIYYHSKFDYSEETEYPPKLDFPSSHTFAVKHVAKGAMVVDIECGGGHVARKLAEKGCLVHGYDQRPAGGAPLDGVAFYHKLDCDNFGRSFRFSEGRLDYVLLLDVLEHVKSPEEFLAALRHKTAEFEPTVVITTPNIAFIVMRLSLLFGQFNYGKRGILDLTHKRLFTFRQLRSTLESSGYEVLSVAGIPPPWPFVFGKGLFSKALMLANLLAIKIWKGLFAYQIAVVAKPLPTLEALLKSAELEKELGISRRRNETDG